MLVQNVIVEKGCEWMGSLSDATEWRHHGVGKTQEMNPFSGAYSENGYMRSCNILGAFYDSFKSSNSIYGYTKCASRKAIPLRWHESELLNKIKREEYIPSVRYPWWCVYGHFYAQRRAWLFSLEKMTELGCWLLQLQLSICQQSHV